LVYIFIKHRRGYERNKIESVGSKLGIIKGLNADIEKYETQIKQKDEQIALDNKMIKALDKKNIKLSKKINKLTGKYDGIKKGTSMDDAINKYRGL